MLGRNLKNTDVKHSVSSENVAIKME